MNVRLQYPFTLTAGVFYEGQLRMNNYTGRLWLITNTDQADDHNVALERIKYFLYHELENTIFINQNNTEKCQQLVQAGLKITTLPGEPIDQIIGIMLYFKLNAITEERMSVLETELSSVLGDGMIYMHSENENVNAVLAPAWWNSSDMVHASRDLVAQDNIVTINAWRELDLQWPERVDLDATGNTIVFADFRDDTR